MLTGAVVCASLAALAMLLAAPRLLKSAPAETGPLIGLPHGFVVLLATLACIMFLVEGAMLDWSALLLTSTKHMSEAQAGIGYMLFSIAMTIGRLGGDAVVSRAGDRATLIWGSGLAIAGFIILLIVPFALLSLAGFLLIGLGASNLVPILFRKAGAQSRMPVELAVAAVTMTGYAGVLLGPAAIGFVAEFTGLQTAFLMLAALLGVVTLSARAVSAEHK